MKSLTIIICGILLLVVSALLFSSCKDDDPVDDPVPTGTDYSKGLFVINEGKFNDGTGTITHYKREDMTPSYELFQTKNNIPLGNIAQSMSTVGNTGFIVVNNANLVWMVTMKSFQSKGAINFVNLPRYLLGVGNEVVFISSWDNKVVVADYLSLVKIAEVPTGTGPEKMMVVGNYTWVLNQGGFSIDSTITVINNQSYEVDRTIQVYPRPTGIQQDKNGNLWVICSGQGWSGFPASGDTEGHLLCINPSNDEILFDISFTDTEKHPEKLAINSDGDVLYYLLPDGIYKHDIESATLESSPLVVKNGIYNIGYDPVDKLLYASDAGSFTSDGWIYRYDPITGELISSHQAGIVPGEFYFSN